jgi:hypothetical protein
MLYADSGFFEEVEGETKAFGIVENLLNHSRWEGPKVFNA